MRHSFHRKRKRIANHVGREGFGLIVIAALFTAFSVVATVALERRMATEQIQNQQVQQNRVSRLSAALVKYAQYEGRLPCPAKFGLAIADAQFGQEINSKRCDDTIPTSTLTGDNVEVLNDTGGTPTEMIRGVVPVNELARVDGNITAEDAFDEEGSFIMYVVNRNLTHLATGDANVATDHATIFDATNGMNITSIDFVLISYGRDKVGAIPRNGSAITITCPTLTATNFSVAENCNNDNRFRILPKVTSDRATTTSSPRYFDDDIAFMRVTCPNGSLSRSSDGQCSNAFCWGQNDVGQLGNGTTNMTPNRNPVAVTLPDNVAAFQKISVYEGTGNLKSACAIAATFHPSTGALLPFGDVYCWGNWRREVSPAAPYATPQPITGGALPTNFAFTDVQVGSGSTCGVGGVVTGLPSTPTLTANDGNIYCWGNDTNGNLGNGVAGASATAPVVVTKPISPDTGTAITAFSAPAGGKVLSGDGDHWCAIGWDGVSISRVYCWGDHTNGKLGIAAGGPATSPIAAATVNSQISLVSGAIAHSLGGHGTTAYTTDGRLIAWGKTAPFTVGTVFTMAPPTIDAGELLRDGDSTHHCVANRAGVLYCAGSNSNGQLGNTTGGGPAFGVGSGSLVFSALSANNQTSCGLAHDTSRVVKAYCWGENDQGQIGDGTAVDKNTPTAAVMPRGVNSFIELSSGGSTTCALSSVR